MSESKLTMQRKLGNVQRALMGKRFEDISLHSLLPVIFEECLKEKIVFWFNFIEDSCVLNLRDTRFDNYELNIRQHIGNIPSASVDDIKVTVLCNAFLIVPNETAINVGSSAQKETVKEDKDKPITTSNIVPPSAIRVAIEECEKQGEPITRKNIESKLNLKGMTQDKRRQCIAYLRDMKE